MDTNPASWRKMAAAFRELLNEPGATDMKAVRSDGFVLDNPILRSAEHCERIASELERVARGETSEFLLAMKEYREKLRRPPHKSWGHSNEPN